MTAILQAQVAPLNSPSILSKELMDWKASKVSPVAPSSDRHSIHSYFVSCPESPDGRYVLYYTSGTPEGELGDIRILERATGKETILAENIHTEDAHRAACQQWFEGGKKVAFHDYRDGHWVVVEVDIATGKQKILVEDRQIGFGTPNGSWAPVYGSHWKQGEHRDLELVHIDTGEIRTAVKVADVLKDHRADVEALVGEGDVSIFFPVMSPDGKKVFFKMARGSGTDDFKSKDASKREGKFIYEVDSGKFIRLFPQWGHPSWSPDSTGIFERGNVLFNIKTGDNRRFALGSPSDHPSISPDGKLFVTDADISKREGTRPGEWGITIGDLQSDEYLTFYRFDNSGGAKSWRRNHPHPTFSADGQRLYFNVNDGPWTRLYVAEKGKVSPVGTPLSQ